MCLLCVVSQWSQSGLASFLSGCYLCLSEDLLGKAYVMVGIWLYYWDVQIAAVWFVREMKVG